MQVFQNLLVQLFFFLRFALYKKYPVALKGHLIFKKNSVVFQINESLIIKTQNERVLCLIWQLNLTCENVGALKHS